MPINLRKGQKIDLKKESGETLKNVTVGLGWDAPKKSGFFSLFGPKTPKVDCDASCIMCINGKCSGKNDIVFFNNLKHSSGSVVHCGDNRTGNGEGDDEQISVDLSAVPDQYDKLVFVVTIYDAESKAQHFGMIKNAFIRIVDNDSHDEICRFNLTEDYENMMSMIFGELYRKDGVWKFNAIGEGTTDGSIGKLAKRFQ